MTTNNNSQPDLSPWSSSSVSNPQSTATTATTTTTTTTAAGAAAAMVINNNKNKSSNYNNYNNNPSSQHQEKHHHHHRRRQHDDEEHHYNNNNFNSTTPPPHPPTSNPFKTAITSLSSTWCLPAQGTGALAVCLWDIPYPFPHSRTLAITLWVLTLLQLLLFLTAYSLRAFWSPKRLASRLSVDNVERACLACVPVTFCTCVQLFGSIFGAGAGAGEEEAKKKKKWARAALGLWWFGFLLSVLAVVGITRSLLLAAGGRNNSSSNSSSSNLKRKKKGLAQVLPSFQMPVVAVVTCAAVGGTLCTVTDLEPKLRQPVVVVSYLLLGLGMPLAVFLDVLFLARLVVSGDGGGGGVGSQVKEKLEKSRSRSRSSSSPSSSSLYGSTVEEGSGSSAASASASASSAAATAASAALALACQQMILAGPWGQGSAAMQQLGQAVSMEDLQAYNSGELLTTKSGPILGYLSMFMGLLSWGEATLWWIWSLLAVCRALRQHRRIGKPVRFEMAFWALVFPWGVYTHSAEKLVDLLDSPAFRVWSTVLFLLMFIIWLYCTVMTVVAGRRLLGISRGSQQQQQPQHHPRHVAQSVGDNSTDHDEQIV